MQWIQILGVMFGLLLLYMTFLNYKRKEFTIKEALSWSAICAALIIFSVIPKFLDPFLKRIGVLRLLDFLVIVGFMFLLIVVFYVYHVVRRTQMQLTNIVRKIALEKKRK
ncbi:DUF2304 domain-containing protein [Candidatus Woesearchaeota archaeon]|nr:DUF2304 domain-containing protein [Candidatus Woesearchaeota archaeon]